MVQKKSLPFLVSGKFRDLWNSTPLGLHWNSQCRRLGGELHVAIGIHLAGRSSGLRSGGQRWEDAALVVVLRGHSGHLMLLKPFFARSA